MNENVDSLILEILRGMQSDLTDLSSETRDGMREVLSRLSAIEEKIGGHILGVADLNSRYGSVIRRIERIEKCLELPE